MLEPGKLKEAFAKVEKENWMFRSFLKGEDEIEVDKLVHKMHRELFDKVDCIACSNCCILTRIALTPKDIEKISRRLGMMKDVFSAKYLRRNDDGDMEIYETPCPFHTEKGCSIYDIRPQDCRTYPHTNKTEITSRLIGLVNNCEICPVVFEIFERLKNIYHDAFEEYKKEYAYLFER
jgi:Fe-S-cluster containining protein